MTRQPTISTDSVAQDQIRAFVERVERIESEVKDLNKDKSEVYAEARGNGFDVKVLKIVVAHRRQDHAERMEQEALIELYEAALAGRSLDEDETGTVDATRAPAPAPEADRREPSDKIEAALRTSERRAKAAGKDKPVDIKHEPASHVAAAVGSDPADEAEEATGQADSSATQSTAARMDVHQTVRMTEQATPQPEPQDRIGGSGNDPQVARPAAGTQAPPVDTIPIRQDEPVDAAVDGPQTVDGRRNSEPVRGQSGAMPDSAGAPAALEGAHNPTSGAVPTNVTAFTRKPHDGPVSSKGLARHKLCQHVDLCAGTWREACFDCRKAAADAQGLTA